MNKKQAQSILNDIDIILSDVEGDDKTPEYLLHFAEKTDKLRTKATLDFESGVYRNLEKILDQALDILDEANAASS